MAQPGTSAVSSLEARRAEKKKARLRQRVLRLLALTGGIAVLAFAFWLFFTSSVFSFSREDLTIEGAQSGAVDERIVADVNEEVEPLEGTPLLRISPREIEQSLAQSVLISEASVSRSWPSGLRVTVWPREAALAQIKEQGYDLVGADGVVVGSAEDLPDGIPAVSLSALGEQGAETQAGAALRVWQALSPEVKAVVSRIDVSGSQIFLDLTSGARVVWGDSSDSQVKAQVLDVLLANVDVGSYDVSDPSRPSTR